MSKKNKLKIPTKPAHGQGRTQRTSVLGVRPAMQRRLLSHIPRAPLSTASSSWRSQLSTLVKYTRKLHAKVAKSRKKSAKMTATAANRNKRQQKLRQNSCAVAFFFGSSCSSSSLSRSRSRSRRFGSSFAFSG